MVEAEESGVPLKLKIVFSYLVVLIVTTVTIFKFVEGVSWLDAIYFVVVTMSTVGFGDVVPRTPLSKLFAIILIISSLSLVAVSFNLLLEVITSGSRTARGRPLPEEPLELEGHVIVAGYGPIASRFSSLAQARRFEVLVVDIDQGTADLAAANGHPSIVADISRPEVMRLLNLEQATAMILLMGDDKLMVKTGILARSVAPKCLLYGPIRDQETRKIANRAGILQYLPFIESVGDHLWGYLKHPDVMVFSTLNNASAEAHSVFFVEAGKNVDLDEKFNDHLKLGGISWTQHTYVPPEEDTAAHHHLIALHQDERPQSVIGITTDVHDRVILAGYGIFGSLARKSIDLPDEQIVALVESPEQRAHAEADNLRVVEWKLGEADKVLGDLIEHHDLVVSSFGDDLNSMMLATTLQSLDRHAHLIQVVYLEDEIEGFLRVGAEGVISINYIAASALFSTMLQDLKMPPSYVFANAHLFEHLVDDDDWFDNQTLGQLEKKGYYGMFFNPADKDEFIETDQNFRLRNGDRVMFRHES